MFFEFTLTMTSLRANTPMRIGRISRPLISLYEPNVNLGLPVIGSMPIADRSSPTAPAIRAFTILPPDALAMIVRPKIANEK